MRSSLIQYFTYFQRKVVGVGMGGIGGGVGEVGMEWGGGGGVAVGVESESLAVCVPRAFKILQSKHYTKSLG